MPVGGVLSIFGGIIGLAIVFTAVSHTSTATIIKNIFDGFAGSLRAAMGR